MDRIIQNKKWSVKKVVWLAICSIILILLIWNVIFADNSATYRISKDRLQIAAVKKDVFQDFISVSGTVQPRQVVFLDAIEGGYVEDIIAEEGTFVSKGATILRLSNTNLHLSIMNQEASLSEQMNNLRNTRLIMEQTKLDLKKQLLEIDYLLTKTERDFKQNQDLFDKEFISKETYQTSKEQHEYYQNRGELIIEMQEQDSLFRAVQIQQLENSVERMQTNLSLVRQKLDNLSVTAPISGLLTSINAQLGQSIAAGQRLGQINDMEQFILSAEVDEYYITRFHLGLLSTFEFSNQLFNLEVRKLYPEVRNGKFSIELAFVNEFPVNLRVGQTFRLKLELGDSKEANLVTRGGFFQSTGGRWIFVLDENGKTAYRRAIRLGRMNPAFYEVIDGLQPNERVIVSNYESFSEVEKLIIK
jgi:HlyD family secretion protein